MWRIISLFLTTVYIVILIHCTESATRPKTRTLIRSGNHSSTVEASVPDPVLSNTTVSRDSLSEGQIGSQSVDLNTIGHGASNQSINLLSPSCGECNKSACPDLPDRNCPMGQVLDLCSCCTVCAALEGNRCFNATLGPFSNDSNLGICGPSMSCILRTDLESDEPLEALCECQDKRFVCGTDDKTYQSECKFREKSHSDPNLMIKSWSPCISAPRISTPVENVTVAMGEDASLSCEVKGYPSPVIHWEFKPENSDSSINLPGEDSSIVVTVRGGPEQMMTTSWIQIISVSPKVQGTYKCIAVNSVGRNESSAMVSVYKMSSTNFNSTLTNDNIAQ